MCHLLRFSKGAGLENESKVKQNDKRRKGFGLRNLPDYVISTRKNDKACRAAPE